MKILIFGDLIIDKYVCGEVNRISPEAPIPILNKRKEEFSAGGALNLACNLASLGCEVSGYFPIGKGERKLINDLIPDKINIDIFFKELEEYSLPLKTRYTDPNYHQLLRVDDEKYLNIDWWSYKVVKELISETDIIIVSDYCKGAINNKLIKILKNSGKKLFVDTKRSNIEIFSGVYLLKPNLKESISIIISHSPKDERQKTYNFSEIEKRLQIISSELKIKNFIVTRGAEGSTLIKAGSSLTIEAESISKVFDVSGAGDTFFAGLIYAYINKYSERDSLTFANKCAAQVIKVPKTSIINRSKPKGEEYIDDIGFTNGCFDIIHAGHLSYLEKASKKCKKLIIGLNSDESIKRLKGKKRPINNERQRKYALDCLPFIAEVIIFNEDTPENLIKEIVPNVLFKGGDYRKENIVGSDFVINNGGKVEIIEYIEDYSSTSIIQRIIEMER